MKLKFSVVNILTVKNVKKKVPYMDKEKILYKNKISNSTHLLKLLTYNLLKK